MNNTETESAKTETQSAQYLSMLENMPINVILSDLDFNITYINPKSRETLKSIEHLLPAKVEEILGKSIDIFHKNPAHQRAILSNPKNLPHEAQIKLGNEYLNLLVSPVWDQNKNYTGAMVTWDIITDKVKLREEVLQFSDGTREKSVSITDQSANVASGAQKLEKTSESISKSVSTLTSSIDSISTNIKNTEHIVKTTEEMSKTGISSINQAVEAMDLISKSSEEINEIIGVIREIAQQTELLAFNAAIEAARAGDHGRGFAVVAEEVRKLSERSSQSTKNIGTLIKESLKRIELGVQTSKKAGEAFINIAQGVSKTSNLISDISVSTASQLSLAKDVKESVNQITEEAKQSSKASEVIATKIVELNKDVSKLTELIKEE